MCFLGSLPCGVTSHVSVSQSVGVAYLLLREAYPGTDLNPQQV